jgi:serine protease AprX
MARITINGVSIDPLEQADALRGAGLESADASHSNYLLIQTTGPLSAEEKAQLTGLGVDIQEYVPENTYMCGYRASDLNAIRSLSFVAWADTYFQAFKIPPSLRTPAPESAASVLPAAIEQAPSRKPRQVDVVFHEDVDPNSQELRTKIAEAAGLNADDLQTGRRKIRLTVEEGQLGQLASLDEVRHIEEVPTRQLFNNVARPILNADVVVNGTPYQGDGQIIAVADTGLDRGSTTNVHAAFTGRVSKLYALGRTSPARTDDPHGHGTHVAGSALGDGTSTSMGGPIQGTAPRARLVLQSTLDAGGGLGGLPADLHDLFEPPYDDDARVHTNSWGTTVPGLPYDASAQEIDDVVWNRQDLVITFAAGNDGTDKDRSGVVDVGSIGAQSAAKNCISVGASESSRPTFEPDYGTYWPTDFPADPINSDRQANDPQGLVAFSSRGPTKEGRIKPDVVAPGTCILSTLSRAVAHPSHTFGTSSDSLFFFDSGTSMATPLVAGCVAVLRETLVKNGSPNPTAALLKALLINGATELPGQYSPTEAGLSPNNNSGFGRVDLAGSVIIPGANPNAGFGEEGPLKQGEENSFTIDIPEQQRDQPQSSETEGVSPTSAGITLKITLVWTDPPGAALQNDLDLIVRAANGEERHGNMGTNTGFDRSNNVEQITWTNMPPGKADVTIRAFRITTFPQPYAYAWRLG